jgi:hypothetical protein
LEIQRLSARSGNLPRTHNRREHIADSKPLSMISRRPVIKGLRISQPGQSPAERVASAASMGQMQQTNK